MRTLEPKIAMVTTKMRENPEKREREIKLSKFANLERGDDSLFLFIVCEKIEKIYIRENTSQHFFDSLQLIIASYI